MPATPEDIRAALQAKIAAIESGADVPFRKESDGGSARSRSHVASEGMASPFGTSDDASVRLRSRAASDGFSDGTPDDLAGEAADPERAFRKIERLCLVREQASEQLRRRLVRDGFEPETVEAALERALACGLVDDRRFADVLVRSRLSQGKGRRGIAAELEGLGIDADGVEALSEDDGNDAGEVERALAVLDRKPPRAKNRRDAAYRRLAGKGFGASVASTAARLWCESHPE